MTSLTQSRLLSTSLTTGENAAPTIESADGVWFTLADGRRVLDASNTAGPLGHQHPEMVEAIRQAATAPAINEGWGWRGREQAAEDLVGITFGDAPWVGAARFFLSASEANDVALALTQALTGRQDLATRERAYHGGAGLAREMTVQPQWHGGLSAAGGGVRPAPSLVDVHELPAPASARVTGQPDPTTGDEWLPDAKDKLARSAAVILDYSQGGVYHNARYQDRVAALARETGTIWIADETVTGLGRVGGWYQFEAGSSRPDMVTMGKSLAGGSTPAGAIVMSQDLVDQLSGSSWQTYSTFRGHPITVAAISAHLRIVARDRLHERATELDSVMFEGLSRLADSHPGVARIDGRGLHWTIELHGPDWRTWRGEEAEPLASRVVARALDAGVLTSTSAEQTSLFLSPPLIVEREQLELLFEALDHALKAADEEYDRQELA